MMLLSNAVGMAVPPVVSGWRFQRSIPDLRPSKDHFDSVRHTGDGVTSAKRHLVHKQLSDIGS